MVRIFHVALFVLATLGMLVLMANSARPSSPARADASSAEGRYIVTYDSGSASRRGFSVARETARLENAHGFKSRMRYRHTLDGFAADLSPSQAATVRNDPRVASVTRDRQVRAVGRFPLAAGEQPSTGAPRIGALSSNTVHGASSVAVAVLDTGIDFAHPDLNAAHGGNCIGTGPASDNNGHGTHVAGVIGARNNGSGVVGVAPGTRMYAVKVLDSQGTGFLSEVICGIEWVTQYGWGLGVRVVNLSLEAFGNPSTCATDPLHAAICSSTGRGVTYTVAAGNGGADFGAPPHSVPAAFPEVLTVTAMSDNDGQPGAAGGAPSCTGSAGEQDDRYASFSNYATSAGDAAHTVAAPGVCIRSSIPGGYSAESGTSTAAPHVAGVVALCFGEDGGSGPCSDMTPAEVIQQIRADAAANATAANGFVGDPAQPVFGRQFGHLVSALDPSIRRIAARPPAVQAAPPSPPPADTSVALISLRVPKRQDVDKLRAIIRLGEPGVVRAGALVRLRRARASAPRLVRSRSVRRSLAPNLRRTLRFKLRRTSLRRVKRALRRGRRLRARVTVTVRDGAGNSLRKRRLVRLTR